jgi:hypothetical protein
LTNAIEVFENLAVKLHHHDIFGGIDIEKFLSLHLAGLHDDKNFLLDFIERRYLTDELNRVSTGGDSEHVGHIEVAPKLFKSVPI